MLVIFTTEQEFFNKYLKFIQFKLNYSINYREYI